MVIIGPPPPGGGASVSAVGTGCTTKGATTKKAGAQRRSSGSTSTRITPPDERAGRRQPHRGQELRHRTPTRSSSPRRDAIDDLPVVDGVVDLDALPEQGVPGDGVRRQHHLRGHVRPAGRRTTSSSPTSTATAGQRLRRRAWSRRSSVVLIRSADSVATGHASDHACATVAGDASRVTPVAAPGAAAARAARTTTGVSPRRAHRSRSACRRRSSAPSVTVAIAARTSRDLFRPQHHRPGRRRPSAGWRPIAQRGVGRRSVQHGRQQHRLTDEARHPRRRRRGVDLLRGADLLDDDRRASRRPDRRSSSPPPGRG